jgi:cardiolipin synthase
METLDPLQSNLQFLKVFWLYLLGSAGVLIIAGTALHVLLKKRDVRAAIGWLGLIWFAPVLGAILYWLFGVNRIQRRAKSKFAEKQVVPLPTLDAVVLADHIEKRFGDSDSGLPVLAHFTDKVTRQPLMDGNSIEPLINGDQAFPKMLAAIEQAENTVTLCSYIFDNDGWGEKFRIALRDAVSRGVEVRALIDAVGARYSFPSIISGLRKDGVKVEAFMETRLPWRFRYLNLRNHRKIMVIDGKIGFTGGLNIREGGVLTDKPAYPFQDIHFLLHGPIVAQLQCAFAEDWSFTTGERLEGNMWFPDIESCGTGMARGLSDGPDEDFGKLRLVILGALASARKSIRITTPYFLPDNELTTSLTIAALRGVDIEIMLPGTTNLRLVKWASEAGLEELIESGCRIFYTAPPFDHSKLMVVDDNWVLLGSANWDSRSLTLNFEFNVECYDENLASSVCNILNGKMKTSREVTREEIQSRFIGIHLRNRFLRLFSPYL